MNSSQASTRSAQDSTDQYMSHGVSCAGSDVLRALYEAKRGKRKEAMELRSFGSKSNMMGNVGGEFVENRLLGISRVFVVDIVCP